MSLSHLEGLLESPNSCEGGDNWNKAFNPACPYQPIESCICNSRRETMSAEERGHLRCLTIECLILSVDVTDVVKVSRDGVFARGRGGGGVVKFPPYLAPICLHCISSPCYNLHPSTNHLSPASTSPCQCWAIPGFSHLLSQSEEGSLTAQASAWSAEFLQDFVFTQAVFLCHHCISSDSLV